MKLYYRAVTQDGKSLRGMIEAKDEHEAALYLRKHQMIPVKITKATVGGFRKYIPFLPKSNAGDLVFFTRQLSSMLSSGLTLMQALHILRNQVQNKGMAEILQSIIVDVENGKTFADSIEKFPGTFNPIYTALIKTAESSGFLDKVLLRLADNLEKQSKLKSTIRGALIYPVIILLMMVLVMVVMLIFVIPNLSTLYSNLNMSLPIQTLIVVGASNFLINYWYIAIALVVGGGWYFKLWYSRDEGKRLTDRYILKVPVFGKLMMQNMMAEFTRTLGLLVSSGSLVVDSLMKTGDVVGNTLYKDAILMVAKRVEKGISIGDAMEASPLFPPMVVEMVKIGEQTGKLDDSLMRASEYFEREVEQTVKVLTTLLEPIIMVFLAVGVGFLVLAVITPIYGILSSIQ